MTFIQWLLTLRDASLNYHLYTRQQSKISKQIVDPDLILETGKVAPPPTRSGALRQKSQT